MGLLSALGLLALASLQAAFRAPDSASSSPRNPSTPTKTTSQVILPTKVDLSPIQVDGVLITPGDGDGDGAGAGAAAPAALLWVGGADSTRGAQADQPEREGLEDGAGGGLGEGAARDGKPRCWTDEEGKSRCLPTVFFFGVSKCGELKIPNGGGGRRFAVLTCSRVWCSCRVRCLYHGVDTPAQALATILRKVCGGTTGSTGFTLVHCAPIAVLKARPGSSRFTGSNSIGPSFLSKTLHFSRTAPLNTLTTSNPPPPSCHDASARSNCENLIGMLRPGLIKFAKVLGQMTTASH